MMTLDRMRADVARLIGLEPEEVADDADLSDLGLDSMRLMQLAMGWEQAGLAVDFGVLAEYSTLRDWWREIVAPQVGT